MGWALELTSASVEHADTNPLNTPQVSRELSSPFPRRKPDSDELNDRRTEVSDEARTNRQFATKRDPKLARIERGPEASFRLREARAVLPSEELKPSRGFRVGCDICREPRARAALSGLRSTASGAMCFPLRFGGSMNLNVHFHVAVPDGVFTATKGAARADFWRLPTPDRMDVETLTVNVEMRVVSWLRRRGFLN